MIEIQTPEHMKNSEKVGLNKERTHRGGFSKFKDRKTLLLSEGLVVTMHASPKWETTGYKEE